MSGNGVGQGCPAAENMGAGDGTWKNKPEQKNQPPVGLWMRNTQVQRGGMGKRSGRELFAPLLDLQVV